MDDLFKAVLDNRVSSEAPDAEFVVHNHTFGLWKHESGGVVQMVKSEDGQYRLRNAVLYEKEMINAILGLLGVSGIKDEGNKL